LAVERLLAAPPTLVHYRAVLERSVTPAALANSLGVAALTTLLAVALGAPGAYALARLPVPGKHALLLGVVACTAFPQVTIVGPVAGVPDVLERAALRVYLHRDRGQPHGAGGPRALPRRLRGAVGRHRRRLDAREPAADPDRGRAPALARPRAHGRRAARLTCGCGSG